MFNSFLLAKYCKCKKTRYKIMMNNLIRIGKIQLLHITYIQKIFRRRFLTNNFLQMTYVSFCAIVIKLYKSHVVSHSLSFLLPWHSLSFLLNVHLYFKLTIQNSYSVISWLYYPFPFKDFSGRAFHWRLIIFLLRVLRIESISILLWPRIRTIISMKKNYLNIFKDHLGEAKHIYFHCDMINSNIKL